MLKPKQKPLVTPRVKPSYRPLSKAENDCPVQQALPVPEKKPVKIGSPDIRMELKIKQALGSPHRVEKGKTLLLKKNPQPTKKKSILSPKHAKKLTINPEDLSTSNVSDVQPSQHRPTPMPMTARDPGSYFQPDHHDPYQRKQRLHWTLKLAEKIRNENELQVKHSQAQEAFLREQELTPPKPEKLKVMAFSESRGPHVPGALKVLMRQPSETVMS